MQKMMRNKSTVEVFDSNCTWPILTMLYRTERECLGIAVIGAFGAKYNNINRLKCIIYSNTAPK